MQIRCARAAIIAAARPRRGFDKTASAEDLKGAELSEEERPSLRQPPGPESDRGTAVVLPLSGQDDVKALRLGGPCSLAP